MTAKPSPSAGELYVHRINDLREEIRHAMAAISSNRLQALEESLWRQEILCTGLEDLLGSEQNIGALNTGLRDSLAALYQVNRSYVELVRQAQASNLLLCKLCQGYKLDTPDWTHPATTRYSLEA